MQGMNTKASWIVALMVIIVASGLGIAYWRGEKSRSIKPIATVSYVCNEGRAIVAAYYQGEAKPSTGPDMPPIPGGSVSLALSDGRAMTLAQTISASGIRYANADESFVFWSKGNGALVLENNEEKSYIGCIEVVPDPGTLPQVYESGALGFSLRYPTGFVVDEAYRYQAFGPGKDIAGVKFTISPLIAQGTNLSDDSYVSVEQIPQVQDCTAELFLDQKVSVQTVTDGEMIYSVASSTGAAAGNRYEETIYALPGTNPCIAVRYFIHYGVFENYEPGMVERFDQVALLAQFDAIRRTLVIVP